MTLTTRPVTHGYLCDQRGCWRHIWTVDEGELPRLFEVLGWVRGPDGSDYCPQHRDAAGMSTV